MTEIMRDGASRHSYPNMPWFELKIRSPHACIKSPPSSPPCLQDSRTLCRPAQTCWHQCSGEATAYGLRSCNTLRLGGSLCLTEGVASVLARQACGQAYADVTAGADRGRGGPPVKKPIIIPKPINLPSRRAENHGFDPNISLGGWSQSKPTGAPAPSQQQQQQASQPQSQPDARPGWAGGIQAPQAPSLTNNERAFPKLGNPPPGEKPAGKILLVQVKKVSFQFVYFCRSQVSRKGSMWVRFRTFQMQQASYFVESRTLCSERIAKALKTKDFFREHRETIENQRFLR